MKAIRKFVSRRSAKSNRPPGSRNGCSSARPWPTAFGASASRF